MAERAKWGRLTISQLGEKVGLSPKTIRFYEESGVIELADRGENGYRLYDQAALKQLQLIKNARDLGLPLSEIKKLMVGCEADTCHHNKQYIDTTIKNYVSLLEAKIAQFTLLKNKLEQLQTCIDQKEAAEECSYCCNILHQLSNPGESKGGKT